MAGLLLLLAAGLLLLSLVAGLLPLVTGILLLVAGLLPLVAGLRGGCGCSLLDPRRRWSRRQQSLLFITNIE